MICSAGREALGGVEPFGVGGRRFLINYRSTYAISRSERWDVIVFTAVKVDRINPYFRSNGV